MTTVKSPYLKAVNLFRCKAVIPKTTPIVARCESSFVFPLITHPSEHEGTRPNASIPDMTTPRCPSDSDKDATSPAVHLLPPASGLSSKTVLASAINAFTKIKLQQPQPAPDVLIATACSDCAIVEESTRSTDLPQVPEQHSTTIDCACDIGIKSYNRPWRSAREKFRHAVRRLKAKFNEKINYSTQSSEEENFGDPGYSSPSDEDQNGRAQWDIMHCIPMSAFKALLLRSLPEERKKLGARTLGVSSGTYHYVVFLDAMGKSFPGDEHAFKTPCGLTIENVVIKVPAHGTHKRWCAKDEYMMTQEAETMKYLFHNTTLPVPQVFAYSATLDNSFGFPYIIMSHLSGRFAMNIWFDQPYGDHTPELLQDSPSLETEQKRVNFLRSLVFQMTKLKDLPFDGIGMPSLSRHQIFLTCSGDVRLPVDITHLAFYERSSPICCTSTFHIDTRTYQFCPRRSSACGRAESGRCLHDRGVRAH
jgi:hypothetical protein